MKDRIKYFDKLAIALLLLLALAGILIPRSKARLT